MRQLLVCLILLLVGISACEDTWCKNDEMRCSDGNMSRYVEQCVSHEWVVVEDCKQDDDAYWCWEPGFTIGEVGCFLDNV